MKVKKLDINNINECQKWEDFVFKNGYLYQSYKWIKILKEAYDINSLYLFLEDNNEIISALPLFHMKIPLLKNELVSIPHIEAGGFIAPEYYKYFFEYISINCNINNLKIYQFNEEIGDFPKNDMNSLFMVDMPDTMEKVYTYVQKGIKRSIKNLLKKSNIEVISGNSDEFIENFYYFHIIRNKEFGTPHHSFKFIKSLVKTFGDNCVIFIAKQKNKLLGASLIIFYNNIGYHIYHVIPKKYLKMKTGLLIYYYVFKESFNRGMKKFSFGRSPKGSGVYKFKTQMQATPYPLYIYNFVFRGDDVKAKKIKILNEKYFWVANIWSKLPISLTNYFSPKLRKWVY